MDTAPSRCLQCPLPHPSLHKTQTSRTSGLPPCTSLADALPPSGKGLGDSIPARDLPSSRAQRALLSPV